MAPLLPLLNTLLLRFALRGLGLALSGQAYPVSFRPASAIVRRVAEHPDRQAASHARASSSRKRATRAVVHSR